MARDPTRAPGPTLPAAWRDTFVTGASGFIGATSPANSSTVAIRVATVREHAPTTSPGWMSEPSSATSWTAARAPGDARRRPCLPRRRHDIVARAGRASSRSTSMEPGRARGSATGRCRAGRLHVVDCSDRPGGVGSTADETQVFRAGRYGLPYLNSKHEAELEACVWPPRACRWSSSTPRMCFGRGDIYRSSTEIVRRFLRVRCRPTSTVR